LWWYRPWQRTEAQRVVDAGVIEADSTEVATTLQRIADLDDAFEAGEIDQDEYRRRREALKATAVALRRGRDD
jgi:hypothetical protein